MLDKEDLQAIQSIMEAMEQRTDKKLEAMEQRTDKKLEAMEQRTDKKLEAMEQRLDTKLVSMEQRIMKGAAILMDAEFTKHFKLLSEQQDNVLSHVPNDEDLDIIDGRIEDMETIIKQHTREIQQLKKAN